MKTARELELGYRDAFKLFSLKAKQVQELTAVSGSDPEMVEAALIELEVARFEYQKSRDAWVKQLLLLAGREDHAVHTSRSHFNEDDVRAIAELLWESAGRPEGTAAEDWRQAEEIVGKAGVCAA